MAQQVRQAVQIPVTSVGGYTDPDLMERFLTEGKCDAFVLGRSILADPQLPTKVTLPYSICQKHLGSRYHSTAFR